MGEQLSTSEMAGATSPRRRGGPRAWLELIRVFLTPSAVADSWAGMVLAGFAPGAALPGPTSILGVAVCSVLTFWFGLVSNDLFDRRRDCRTGTRRTEILRPIARGDISPRAAVFFAGALVLAAAAAAAGVLLVWAVLVGVVLLYNGGGKRIPVVGNLLMGSCRALNLVLGAAAVLGSTGVLSSSAVLCGALVVGAYIAVVTAVSTLEDRPFGPGHLLAAGLPALGIPGALVALAPGRWVGWGNAALLSALIIVAAWGALHARSPAPHGAAVFVRTALGGIFLVDAGSLIAFAPAGASPLGSVAVLYGLLVIAWMWKRRWIRAGSAGS